MPWTRLSRQYRPDQVHVLEQRDNPGLWREPFLDAQLLHHLREGTQRHDRRMLADFSSQVAQRRAESGDCFGLEAAGHALGEMVQVFSADW